MRKKSENSEKGVRTVERPKGIPPEAQRWWEELLRILDYREVEKDEIPEESFERRTPRENQENSYFSG